MHAPNRQPRLGDDALEIAVSDSPASPEPLDGARGATISLLPSARDRVETFDDLILAGDHDDPSEIAWLDDDDLLLEASDVIEVEVARAAIGRTAPPAAAVEEFDVDLDLLGMLEMLDDDDDDQPAATFVNLEVEYTSAADSSAATVADAEISALIDPISVPRFGAANSFAYALSRGLRGMGQSPLVQLLAVGTMAVCMVLLATTTLILQNAQRVAEDLGVDRPVTVYMAPEIDAAAIAQLQARVAALPEVRAVEHVTPELALTRLQAGLGQGDSLGAVDQQARAELLAGVDPKLLPESLEIALAPGVDPGFADALAGRIEAMAGVEEVAVLGPWVQEVEGMLGSLSWLALGVAALVSLACLAIVWSTIRLGVFARRAEIDILRLVGGTGRFVRGPFVVEGVVQGVLGTGLALAGLWLSFELIRPLLEGGMSLLFAAGSLQFFTVIEIALALGFGAMIGLIGSRAAVARHA